MTESVDQLPIPGLEPPSRSASPMERATRRSIVALEAAGLVEERHSMVTQLMIELAQVVDAGRRNGKASAAAMAASEIMAAYQLLLPADEGGETHDAYDDLASELRGIANDVRRELAE